jgi:hypothetical protein
MVAQIDEEKVAVIALAVNPARKPDRSAVVGKAQLAAGMRAIGVHGAIPGEPAARGIFAAVLSSWTAIESRV